MTRRCFRWNPVQIVYIENKLSAMSKTGVIGTHRGSLIYKSWKCLGSGMNQKISREENMKESKLSWIRMKKEGFWIRLFPWTLSKTGFWKIQI